MPSLKIYPFTKQSEMFWGNCALFALIFFIIAWPLGLILGIEFGPRVETAEKILGTLRLLAVVFIMIKARYFLPFFMVFLLAEHMDNTQPFWSDILGFHTRNIYQNLGEWTFEGSKLWLILTEPNGGLFANPGNLVQTSNLELYESELTDIERMQIWTKYSELYGYGWHICRDTLGIIKTFDRYFSLLILALPVASLISLSLFSQGRSNKKMPGRAELAAFFQNLSLVKYLRLFLLVILTALFSTPFIFLVF